LVVCGDLNGHVGAEADGFEGVHGGKGYGVRNVEGEMFLEFADAMGLTASNRGLHGALKRMHRKLHTNQAAVKRKWTMY
jgi:hypothetical protein